MRYSPAQRTLATTLMAGFTLLGLLIAGQLPALGGLILAIAGLPALLIVLAWGVVWFMIYGILTVSLTSVFGGISSGLMLIPLMLAPAAFLAWAMNLKIRPLQALGLALVTAFLFSSVIWGLSPLFGKAGRDLHLLREQVRTHGEKILLDVKQLQEKQEGFGDSEGFQIFQDQLRSWLDFMALLMPFTFIFCWHLVSVFVFYAGALWLGPRLRIDVAPLPPFSQWRFDWNIIWIFAVGWFLFHAAYEATPGAALEMVRMVGANCLAISKILFFISGFSLVFFFFERYKLRFINRFGLSVLALFLSQLLVWLGIADIWMDFRAPKPVPPANSRSDDDDDSYF